MTYTQDDARRDAKILLERFPPPPMTDEQKRLVRSVFQSYFDELERKRQAGVTP